MKKEFKTSVLMVMLCAVMLNNANANNFIPLNTEFNKTTLSLNNVKKGNKLLIKDLNGLVLYKELIKDSGTYYKGFDLTSLPNGNYYFELDKDVEIQTMPFTVSLGNVSFNKEKQTTVFKPIIRVKNNKILVSKLSLQEKPFEMKVYQDYDNKNYLVYSEFIDNTKVIERIFKLSEKGSYKIVLKTEGREFVEYITI